ncbi:MAG: ABC transporter ATP-binding protein, partial [SAR324 cluster bacterium]|nr:ABC transporter ATP-binding protein [SAR324 cluster bacterium]
MADRPVILQIKQVVKSFGNVHAVNGVNLNIHEGEFFALLGPSGCGKTTLLRMLAGFEFPSEGSIKIDGKETRDIPPNQRPVNMVFQSYAVFPHMNVFDNVAYGLKVAKTPHEEVKERVQDALALVKLDGYDLRKPDQLSGGQRQRVALARALVKRPRVLLLDEPLSALDAKLREAMQLELVKLQKAVGITFVIVTHDQEEALSMADRIAVMENGMVRQVAPPGELYESPNCRFVADFIGRMNLFSGIVEGHEDWGGLIVKTELLGKLTIPHFERVSGKLHLAVRPEKLRISSEILPSSHFSFPGEVDAIVYHGSESHIYLKTDAGPFLCATLTNRSRSSIRPKKGEGLWIGWAPEDTLVISE